MNDIKENNRINSKRISAKLDKKIISSDNYSIRRVKLKSLLHKNKRYIIAAMVFIVLATSAYFIADRTVLKNYKTYTTADGVEIKRMNDDELRESVESAIFRKKFNSARELIRYQKYANSRESKLLLAATYSNEGNFKGALDVYLDLKKQYPEDWTILRNIADQYSALGDKNNALINYEKSLKLLKEKDKDNPVFEDEVYFLGEYIKKEKQ